MTFLSRVIKLLYIDVTSRFRRARGQGLILACKIQALTLMMHPATEKDIVTTTIDTLPLSRDEFSMFEKEEIELLLDGDNEDWAAFEDHDTVDLSNSNLSGTSLLNLLEAKKDSLDGLVLSGCLNLGETSLPENLKLPLLDMLVLDGSDREVTLNPEALNQLFRATKTLQIRNLYSNDAFRNCAKLGFLIQN